jgi:hypothetical protein
MSLCENGINRPKGREIGVIGELFGVGFVA